MMPRWFVVAITLVLFAAVMLAVGWVLKLVVPWLLEAVAPYTGWGPLAGGIVLLGIVGQAFTFWPRDPAGRMRRLSLRR